MFFSVSDNIVILPVSKDLDACGKTIYLNKTNTKSAKQSVFTKEITVKSKVFPKGYIQFSVPNMINQDPDDVCLLVKQDEKAKEFIKFFKNQFS